MTTHTVGILAGMGPAAGADFVRLFVAACAEQLKAAGRPIIDQAYPEHWLAQLPIPDRSAALLQPGSAADPFPMMCGGLRKLQAVGASAIAISCNTAHAWHGRLQAAFPQLRLLHIARETARSLQRQGRTACILLATQGTYRIGLYDAALAECGITAYSPSDAEKALVMEGIYQGVKAGDLALARARFAQVTAAMRQRHGDMPLVMGCTEIPLALPGAPEAAGLALIDPAWELACALAQAAYAG